MTKQSPHPLNVVVLAAGKGTRMKSSLPKVLHCVGGDTLLGHNLNLAQKLGAESIHVVVGHGAELVRERYDSGSVQFVLQAEQKGTGHALAQALPFLAKEAIALVLYGDVPLLKEETLQALVREAGDKAMALLTCHVNNPAGLGRILRNADDEVIGIVEEKDASEGQKQIREINTGIMAIPVACLARWLPALSDDNAQGEYYLTDVVAMARDDGCAVKPVICDDPVEVMGVNNRVQLAELERHLQARIADELMVAGVTLKDPSRIDVRGTLAAGEDCIIDINAVFEGRVELGKNVTIGPNCFIRNSVIADNTVVEANSHIDGADIGKSATIGPYARIRPGSCLSDKVKIGNFVETKKVNIGEGSKVNHLSYIGDCNMGQSVNIGAGTITCNYDGANKFITTIEDHVFVGSNTALVAPVTLGKLSTIGAGSTITKDVAPEELGLTRARQSNITGWKRPVKK